MRRRNHAAIGGHASRRRPSNLGIRPARMAPKSSACKCGDRKGSGRLAWKASAQVIATLGILGSLLLSSLSWKVARDQMNLVEQGQVTDRYGKAIEQLGTHGLDHIEVRLGGIYALERLGQDSLRDQSTISNVLAAFIRNTRTVSGSGLAYAPCPSKLIAPDVQVALEVLARSFNGPNAA